MKIDILSPDTLKLVLSPGDTDRRLSYGSEQFKQTLAGIVLNLKDFQKPGGVSFSGGSRLLVEAFRRPDGGCLLYVSRIRGAYGYDAGSVKKSNSVKNGGGLHQVFEISSNLPHKTETLQKAEAAETDEAAEIWFCDFEDFRSLAGFCRAVCFLRDNGGVSAELKSSLYFIKETNYRLKLTFARGREAENPEKLETLTAEFGRIATRHSRRNFLSETAVTEKFYKTLADEDAVRIISELA